MSQWKTNRWCEVHLRRLRLPDVFNSSCNTPRTLPWHAPCYEPENTGEDDLAGQRENTHGSGTRREGPKESLDGYMITETVTRRIGRI